MIIALGAPSAQTTGGPDPLPTSPNNRTTHYNTVGWYGFFGTIKLNPRVLLRVGYAMAEILPSIEYIRWHSYRIKKVAANIFDQNRIGLLLGYQFSKTLRIEAGYINQTLQFGRLINNRNVFQSNSGLIVNTNFNF